VFFALAATYVGEVRLVRLSMGFALLCHGVAPFGGLADRATLYAKG